MKKKIVHPIEPERVFGLKYLQIKDIIFIIFFCIICAGLFENVEVQPDTFISPIQAEAQVRTIAPSLTPIPTETPEVEVSVDREEIKSYIKEVFGKDADKAFLVLSCENASLNPEAVNTTGNVPEGSRDIGVFQINEYWQGVNGKFLFNWKINVLAAHQIFTDNGNSFERWTCGRKFGV